MAGSKKMPGAIFVACAGPSFGGRVRRAHRRASASVSGAHGAPYLSFSWCLTDWHSPTRAVSTRSAFRQFTVAMAALHCAPRTILWWRF